MSETRSLPARPSLDSLRKQAKRLAREVNANEADAIMRMRAQLPNISPPVSNRDAQLVVAREYGFRGWAELAAEVQQRTGAEIDWFAERARVCIHAELYDELRELLREHPSLIAWRDANGRTLLNSTTSYAMDCLDPERERTYTRQAAAAMLIDAGAIVDERTWMHVIKTGARGMLQLLHQKQTLPRTPLVHAALGDHQAVRETLARAHETRVEQEQLQEMNRALLTACRFGHTGVAGQLLEFIAAADSRLAGRISQWGSRGRFVEFLAEEPGILWRDERMTAWQTFVVLQLGNALGRGALAEFNAWLEDESWFLNEEFVEAQSTLLMPACYLKDRAAFIESLFDREPALLRTESPPHSSHISQALSYGNASLVPVLTRVFTLPDDLPHAAGSGNRLAVERWFTNDGEPALGVLKNHYPASDPKFPRDDLDWGPPTVQQTLDIALAWSVLNLHFEIATFLIDRGANINTDWGTHEPASILHEAAVQGNRQAVEYLVHKGADLTKTDYRYQSTPEGWARYGSNDLEMADFLAGAALRSRNESTD